MTALRSEAINLLENVPEKYLLEIVQYVKNFLQEKEITSEKALQAFYTLRDEAEKNNLQDMSLEEINAEIDAARQFYLQSLNL